MQRLVDIQNISKKRREMHDLRKKGKSKKKSSFKENLNKAEKFRMMDEHKIPLSELYERLKSNPKHVHNLLCS